MFGEPATAEVAFPDADIGDVPAEPAGAARLCKRVFDIALASGLLVLLSPVLLLIGGIIRLTSPGPAIFRQERIGSGGGPFTCWKFRTMRVSSDPMIRGQPLAIHHRDGHVLKLAADPRVTRVGRLLRRTSLDELPQLLNVVKGDMSLVGPRPLMPHMLERHPRLRAARGRMKPGMTGLWQVRAREQNTHVAHMARHDLEYIRNWSLLLDLKILLATLPAVLSGRGAI